MESPNSTDAAADQGRHRNHVLMMVLWCIPLVIIAGVLVASGVVEGAVLLLAVGCMAMMGVMVAMMMIGTSRTNRQ